MRLCLYMFACMIFVHSMHAQFYMYTPGTPAVFSPWDQFGGFVYCTFVLPTGCGLMPYTDSSLCNNVPENVTITPQISQTYRYGKATDMGYIRIGCDTGNPPNMSMVYTTDGTLPDITKPLRGRVASVLFNSSFPTPIILARCIQDGKLPSRIAYFQRMIWDTAVNGTTPPSCDIKHYKELNLPRCNPAVYGARCDGQTIITPTTSTQTTSGSSSNTSGRQTSTSSTTTNSASTSTTGPVKIQSSSAARSDTMFMTLLSLVGYYLMFC